MLGLTQLSTYVLNGVNGLMKIAHHVLDAANAVANGIANLANSR